MRRVSKIVVILVVICVGVYISYGILSHLPYLRTKYTTCGGYKDPVFSATLVDNGENDYVDIKYVSAGTYLGWTPEVFPLEEMAIHVAPIENTYKYTEVGLPSGSWCIGENIRVFFNANVLEKGRLYLLSICWCPYHYWVCVKRLRCE